MTALPDDARTAARRAGLGAAGLALAAWLLIVIGALVRAHGAGLSCPDWPLCHGQLVPDFDAKIALEWGHRLIAGVLSLGVAALGIVILRRRELRARFAAPLFVIVALLAVQVVLGGLTVLLGLAPWTVTGHLVVGNSFALALAWLARGLLEAATGEPIARSRLGVAAGRRVFALCGLVLLQFVLGGLVSSHYAGLACGTTFPLCNGESLAPTFEGPVGLHVIHRLNAYAVALLFGLLAWQLRGAGRIGRFARIGFGLVLLQVAVGAANVLLSLPVEVTALHSAVAAGIALTTGLLAREALLGETASALAPAATASAPALGGAQ
jgi:cytochrome c oxidase assembly protein subunit 15